MKALLVFFVLFGIVRNIIGFSITCYQNRHFNRPVFKLKTDWFDVVSIISFFVLIIKYY